MKPLVVSFAVILMTTPTTRADEPTKSAADARVFELRTYYTNPGKMAALHARFRDQTCNHL